MTSKTLKLALVILLGAAGCSDSGSKQIVKPYVTNAEYVLERVKLAETSGVAFQVKPIRSTACKYMYIEIGKKNATGQWANTNVLYPGKDNRNNFGQNNLENQIHFAEVDGVGEFGVLALGCEPYGGKLQAVQGLLGTFEVEFGKLNYIGELALIPLGTGPRHISKIEVTDRSEFALEQIQLQLPALETYFRPNIMEKFVVKVTPKMQAAMDKFADIKKESDAKLAKNLANLELTIPARNLLLDEYTKAKDILDLWDEKNGYPQQDQSDKQVAERRKLIMDAGRIRIKIKRYDGWIKRDIPFPIIQKFMKLESAADSARRDQDAKYPGRLSLARIKEEMHTPEYKKLSSARTKADEALREFAKFHDL